MARWGAQVAHYVPDKPDDIGQQVTLVDHAIAGRPDAVVFVPVHDTAMNESVQKLNAAGIPIVNYLNRLDRGGFMPWTAIFLACAIIGGGLLALSLPAALFAN